MWTDVGTVCPTLKVSVSDIWVTGAFNKLKIVSRPGWPASESVCLASGPTEHLISEKLIDQMLIKLKSDIPSQHLEILEKAHSCINERGDLALCLSLKDEEGKGLNEKN